MVQQTPTPSRRVLQKKPSHSVCLPPRQHYFSSLFRGDTLPLVIFTLCVIFAVLIEVALLNYFESKFLRTAGQSLSTTAIAVADKLDSFIRERYGDVQILSQASEFRGHDRSAMTAHMRRIVSAYPVYQWIGVTDKTGHLIASTDQDNIGEDRSDQEWFQSVRDHGDIHIRPPRISPDSYDTMVIAFTAPLYHRTGRFIGALTSHVSVPVMEHVVEKTVRALETQWGDDVPITYYLLSQKGEIIADSKLHEEGQANLRTLGLPSAQMVQNSSPGYVKELHLRDQTEVLTGYAASKGVSDHQKLKLGVLIQANRDDIVASIRRNSLSIAASGLVLAFPLGLAFIWILTRLKLAVSASVREQEQGIAANKFQHIVNATPDAMVIIDSTGTIIINNPRAESQFGYDTGELLGKPLSILLPERFRSQHEHHIQLFFEHPGVRPMGTDLFLSALCRDGHEFPAEISLGYMDTPEGRIAIATIRDITQQKLRERELETARVEALTSTKVKSEFLASMSHEIRTPLNAIIGTADLLWETPLSAEQRKYLRVFRRGSDTLLTLINDILDLSKIESGYMTLDSVAFNLEDIVDKVMEMLTMQANEKGLEFASHIDQTVPRHLIGDPVRLTQILVNLLGNALKFTDKGSVTLQVANNKQPRMPGALHFTVSDTGIGIPPDKLDIIFERFKQADSPKTNQYGGTGLGLAISKHLTERMHGHIWVESTVGKGSRFHCTASFDVQSPADIKKSLPPLDLTGTKTLIVDDHPINRLILREMLVECHAETTEAADGLSAIRLLREAIEQSKPFELLLLDCRMPKMDGFQTVDHLKQDSLDSGLTIVMLTSDDWANDIARTYDLALGGYLIKPFRRTDLIKTISIANHRMKEAAIPTQQIPSPPPTDMRGSPRQILVAEDSPDNQMLIRSYLRDTDYQLDIVDNGAQAVGKVKETRYDVVIMDMQMPVMDGFAATRAIRQWEEDHQLAPVPIIALTALALKEEAAKSLKAGCTVHMTKPIRKKTLLDILKQPMGKQAA